MLKNLLKLFLIFFEFNKFNSLNLLNCGAVNLSGSVKLQQESIFMVGQWQLEPHLNRLSRGEEEVILVPKVMALLLVLMEYQGQPLSQDKLIELVWPGQVVSDSSVYQAIAKLRKALGDSASQAEYIERVSGKGYRLIAQVSEIAPVGTPKNTARVKVPLLLLFMVTLVVVVSLMVWDNTESDAIDGLNSVTLVNLQHLSDLKDDPLTALSYVLLSQLTHVKGLKVVHAETRPQTVTTEALLSGKIVKQGDKLQVFLQIQNAENDEILWAQMFEAQQTRVYRLQQSIIDTLLALFGRTQSINTFDQPGVEPRHFDQYLLARHLWAKRNESALEQSRALYEKMRDEQGLFPLAAVGLCETYHFLSIYSDWSLQQAAQKCRPLLSQALTEAPELGEAIAAQALLLRSEGKTDEAASRFKQALALSPNYAIGLMWYADLIRERGQYDKALQLIQRAYELAPMSPVINRSLAYSHLTLSHFSDARYYYQRALTLEPDYFVRPVEVLDFLPLNVDRAQAFLGWQHQHPLQMAKSPYYQTTKAQISLALGQLDQALAEFAAIDQNQLNPGFVLYMQASFKTAQGDLEAAAGLLKRRLEMHPDKRRFVLPYLSNLGFRGEVDEAYRLLLRYAPELKNGEFVITQDNQYLLAFYLYLQHQRQQLQTEQALLERLDQWFVDNPPTQDHYYALWLAFRGHPDAQKVLLALMEQGWLPDFNEDMLAVERLRQAFESSGLKAAEFDKLLLKNRAITSNYISDHLSTDLLSN